MLVVHTLFFLVLIVRERVIAIVVVFVVAVVVVVWLMAGVDVRSKACPLSLHVLNTRLQIWSTRML